jgi:hypothetical protein
MSFGSHYSLVLAPVDGRSAARGRGVGPAPVVIAMGIWLRQGLFWVMRSLVSGPDFKCSCCGVVMQKSYLDLCQ